MAAHVGKAKELGGRKVKGCGFWDGLGTDFVVVEGLIFRTSLGEVLPQAVEEAVLVSYD